jgi:acyl carrier protein
MDEASTASICAAIEKHVRVIGRVADDDTRFGRSVDLFDAGYLDSLGIVALTGFIEDTFGVDLSEADLFDPRFTTIAGMAEIIASRRSRRPT